MRDSLFPKGKGKGKGKVKVKERYDVSLQYNNTLQSPLVHFSSGSKGLMCIVY